MNITIKDNNAAQNMIDQNKVRWKLYSKNIVLTIVSMYILGLVLFLIGMDKFSEYGWRVFNGETAYYVNWHLSESFGVVILIAATYMLFNYFKARKGFFSRSATVADRHLRTNNEILFCITDHSLTYTSYELHQQIKWWLFSSYTVSENYLFLDLAEYPNSYITIDMRLMNPEDYNEFFEFVKQRFIFFFEFPVAYSSRDNIVVDRFIVLSLLQTNGTR